jgi:hypothetical protein
MKTKTSKKKKTSASRTNRAVGSSPLVRRLGFFIELRAGVQTLQWLSGGCRPAQRTEISMWKRLNRLNEAAKRVLLDVDDDGIAEAGDVAICELRRFSA